MREASDIDDATLTFGEIKAITAANPRIKRKMEIEQEIGRLKTLKGSYLQNRYHYQNRIASIPQELQRIDEGIAGLKEDIRLRDDNKDQPIRIGNTTYGERKAAGEMLLAIVKTQQYIDKVVGNISGFDIIPCAYESFFQQQSVRLVGARTHTVSISDSEVGTIQRLENAIENLEKGIEDLQKRKQDREQELSVARQEVDKPFDHEQLLDGLNIELAEIDIELDLSKSETLVVMDTEQEENTSVIEYVPVQEYEDEAVAV